MPNPSERPGVGGPGPINQNHAGGEISASPSVSKSNPHDPFNLTALRSVPDIDLVDVQKILTTVPVRRPRKTEFFRVHSGDEFTVDYYVVEHDSDMDTATYWVTPDLWDALRDHVHKVRLFTCIDKRSNVFLWPAKLPIVDSNTQARSWCVSRLQAAEEAKKVWVRIAGNKAIAAYDIVVARGDLGDPQWPDKSLEELIRIAFQDRLIDSLGHPVVKELNGEI